MRTAPSGWITIVTESWIFFLADTIRKMWICGIENHQDHAGEYEYAANGGRKYLFHNLGGGRFEEVSARMGIQSRR